MNSTLRLFPCPANSICRSRFARLARCRLPLICGAALFALAGTGRADFPYTFTRVGGEYRLQLAPNATHYFGFQYTPGLDQPYTTEQFALGTPGPLFGYTPASGETRAFFRAEAIDVWSPGDFDGDGIDDLWELQHGLNPMNAADAALPNATNPSLTNLQYYRGFFGLTRITEFYSRETSIFNQADAISLEVSIFNNGVNGFALEALSLETTVFNSQSTGFTVDAISAETSVFNTAATPFTTDAFSSEVSVFNSSSTGYNVDVISAETSVFNYGPPGPSVEAISLEVSVLNSSS
jgi:hypothetical protein